MRKIFCIVATLLCACGAMAQSQSEEPKGKAIINVFGNFHTGFGAENDDRGFSMDRSYFGYQYSMGNGLSFKAVMDVGKSSDVGDLQRIAYIKNAQVCCSSSNSHTHLSPKPLSYSPKL